jgi:fluoride exporter
MMMLWWQQLGLVAAGGALGAAGRFVISDSLARAVGTDFPWGTLAVNILGSLLAGFLFVWLEQRGPSAALWRAFLMVGVVGGLTTWSALMVELFLLQRSGGPAWAGAYLAASLGGSAIALTAGLRLAEVLRA